jgi:hypothetical protein
MIIRPYYMLNRTFHINESKKLFTFCALHSAAREINSRLLHARVPP